jgi:RNase P subunit RPR2
MIQECCPNCKELLTKGESHLQPNSRAYATPDITCKCGQELRWTVPMFRVTQSGYVLRLLTEKEKQHKYV